MGNAICVAENLYEKMYSNLFVFIDLEKNIFLHVIEIKVLYEDFFGLLDCFDYVWFTVDEDQFKYFTLKRF